MLSSVKIFGAGSIGNHLANASRRLGWSVSLCDIDGAALDRAKNDIYPGRYGHWDADIALHLVDDAPVGGHDLIIVGTPPDAHIPVAMGCLQEKPKALLIEKPLATPDLAGLVTLQQQAAELGVTVFVGYDHAVSTAITILQDHLSQSDYGRLITLDVDFREHWHGIFSAHHWLSGPSDSYLGFWRRGGGACGEHSHAINMWQHLSDINEMGKIQTVSAEIDYVKKDGCDFDRVCLLQVETENGLIGRIVQDVVTFPVRKEAYLQYESGAAKWHCGGNPKGDVIAYGPFPEPLKTHIVEKTRPDDFIAELNHITQTLQSNARSPISLERGLETMLVIAAAHRSAQEGCKIAIDYDRGPCLEALSPA